MAEPKLEDLISFGQRAIDVAIKKGAEEAEVFLSRVSSTSVNIERGQIVSARARGRCWQAQSLMF